MLDIKHIVFGELQGERTEQRTVCDYCEKTKPCRMFIPVLTARPYYDICKTCAKKYLRE